MHWLWVMARATVAFYMIHPYRSKEAFSALIDGWAGILVSDSYGVYHTWITRRLLSRGEEGYQCMNRLYRELLNALLIVLGILSAGMGLYGFLFSSNFIDGGVTGVSMLVAKITGIPLAVWLPLVNLPCIALGYHQIGRTFAVRSVLAIAGLAVALATIPLP